MFPLFNIQYIRMYIYIYIYILLSRLLINSHLIFLLKLHAYLQEAVVHIEVNRI